MSTSKQTDQNHGQPGLEIALSDGLIVKSPEYPDLQVAPSDAPILQELDHSDLEVAQMVWEIGSSSDEAYAVERRSKGHKSSSTLRRIWDSRPLSFWLVLALIVVIIVAAIGGVEGRSLANQKNLAGNGGVVSSRTISSTGTIASTKSKSTRSHLTATSSSGSPSAPSVVAPKASAPAGCADTFSGTWQFEIIAINSTNKHAVGKRNEALVCKLSNSILTDEDNRTGYIAADYGLQFDNPPLANLMYDAGFYICVDGSLAIDGSALWYSCVQGGFYNIYSSGAKSNCSQVYLRTQF